MPHIWLLLVAVLAPLVPPVENGHGSNPVFRDVVESGLAVDGATVRLPEPTLADGGDDRAAIREVAGDDRAARELLRDSVTAPFILRTRDIQAADAVIRSADLWFVVHARLEDFDLDRAARQADGQSVEAGNMRFATRVVPAEELGLPAPPPAEGLTRWFTRVDGRLLDRIEIQSTNRTVATRSPNSLMIATRTETGGRLPNQWTSITRKGAEEIRGTPRPYPGGISYARVTRLPSEPGALLVEAHFAFVEPTGWFQGNPILRSKLGLIAQDQVRSLRRELARPRPAH